MIWSVLASIVLGAQPIADEGVVSGDTRFEVVAVIKVPANPHGIAFSADGSRAYVACAGADRIAVIDTQRNEVVEELAGGSVPLDVMLEPGGEGLIATQFRGDSLVRVPIGGGKIEAVVALGEGPSLFMPRARRGRQYVVCERADLVYEVDPNGKPTRHWSTGDRPYPGDATDDGILLFVPNRDAGTVSVIDTLNDTAVTQTRVGEHPEGGALTGDDVSYVVACGGSDELKYINTASFEVVATVSDGIGPRPFSVAMTRDGRYGIVNNAGGRTISILDVENRKVVGRLAVGTMPIVVRMHPDGKRIYVSCEGDGTVHVIRMTRQSPAPPPAPDKKTEVVVMGMIHSGHRTSERYSLDVVRGLVRAIGPNEILTEIPPNRFDEAMKEFRESGHITEPRVSRFPEYVDAIFPLLNEMDFRIVPCAGWTAQMSDYRNARLGQIAKDPARKDQWAEYEASMERMERELDEIDGQDNPRVIHSTRYDRIVDAALEGPYNEYFNDDLADGGWDNINAKHYALIARRLDAIRGRGERVLITFGAGHKGWILEHLHERDDVTLLDVGPFLDRVEQGK